MLLAEEWVGQKITLERIGWWSEIAMHEEVIEGFRVELK